jgi:hypothetical protein
MIIDNGTVIEGSIGTTVCHREANYYDDSDFYGTYYDRNSDEFKEVMYDTTRFAGGGNVIVDASEEIMTMYYRRKEVMGIKEMIHRQYAHANIPDVNKEVKVISGKKYFGRSGKVFWKGANKFRTYYRNGYNKPDSPENQVVGIEDSDGKFFIPMSQVSVINVPSPEEYQFMF